MTTIPHCLISSAIGHLLLEMKYIALDGDKSEKNAEDYEKLEAHVYLLIDSLESNWETFTWDRVYKEGKLSKNTFEMFKEYFPSKTFEEYAKDYKDSRKT